VERDDGGASVADQVAHLAHLNARDTTLTFVSRAPQTDIVRLKARMDWKIPWCTITDSFDTDFGWASGTARTRGLSGGLPADPPYKWWHWHDAYGDEALIVGTRFLASAQPRSTSERTNET
jgi:predicted dithiol-disulfide oxidoreductase (DUF899 family)